VVVVVILFAVVVSSATTVASCAGDRVTVRGETREVDEGEDEETGGKRGG
jgi:hypothetical protein